MLLIGSVIWTVDDAITPCTYRYASVIATSKLSKFTKKFYSTLNYFSVIKLGKLIIYRILMTFLIFMVRKLSKQHFQVKRKKTINFVSFEHKVSVIYPLFHIASQFLAANQNSIKLKVFIYGVGKFREIIEDIFMEIVFKQGRVNQISKLPSAQSSSSSPLSQSFLRSQRLSISIHLLSSHRNPSHSKSVTPPQQVYDSL